MSVRRGVGDEPWLVCWSGCRRDDIIAALNPPRPPQQLAFDLKDGER
jgi:hypothetical protein